MFWGICLPAKLMLPSPTRLHPRNYSKREATLSVHILRLDAFSFARADLFCLFTGLPWWLRWLRICLQCWRWGFDPWVGKIPWRRKWQIAPVFLPGNPLGQRKPAGYSPWGHKEFRKMVMITLYARQQKRHRCEEQSFGLCGRKWGWDDLRGWCWNMYIIICEIDRQSRPDTWDRVLRAGTLGWSWGMGWEGIWDWGSGWGTHVHPWLIHINV